MPAKMHANEAAFLVQGTASRRRRPRAPEEQQGQQQASPQQPQRQRLRSTASVHGQQEEEDEQVGGAWCHIGVLQCCLLAAAGLRPLQLQPGVSPLAAAGRRNCQPAAKGVEHRKVLLLCTLCCSELRCQSPRCVC